MRLAKHVVSVNSVTRVPVLHAPRCPDLWPRLEGWVALLQEICKGEETTAAQLERVDGLQCTLSGYEQARQQNEAGTLRSMGADKETKCGDRIGYTTTYNEMVLKEPLTGGTAAAGAPRTASQAPEFRCALSWLFQGSTDSCHSRQLLALG